MVAIAMPKGLSNLRFGRVSALCNTFQGSILSILRQKLVIQGRKFKEISCKMHWRCWEVELKLDFNYGFGYFETIFGATLSVDFLGYSYMFLAIRSSILGDFL